MLLTWSVIKGIIRSVNSVYPLTPIASTYQGHNAAKHYTTLEWHAEDEGLSADCEHRPLHATQILYDLPLLLGSEFFRRHQEIGRRSVLEQ